jgi:hypothetical protein
MRSDATPHSGLGFACISPPALGLRQAFAIQRSCIPRVGHCGEQQLCQGLKRAKIWLWSETKALLARQLIWVSRSTERSEKSRMRGVACSTTSMGGGSRVLLYPPHELRTGRDGFTLEDLSNPERSVYKPVNQTLKMGSSVSINLGRLPSGGIVTLFEPIFHLEPPQRPVSVKTSLLRLHLHSSTS